MAGKSPTLSRAQAPATDTTPRTIAVFDSGVGGLTVLAALRDAAPGHRYVYVGDTARVPYGTKSAATITRYALEAAWYLRRFDPDALVVACNSAAASALPALQAAYPGLPIFGVIAPGARAAAAVSRRGRIGVLATQATVGSKAYQRAIATTAPQARVYELACPLLVPLAEEGLGATDLATQAVAHYLQRLPHDIDTLLLGCTHYPLLRNVIAAARPQSAVIDSAAPLAAAVVDAFGRGGASSDEPLIFATDTPARIIHAGARFLGAPPPPVTQIDLEALVIAETDRTGDRSFLKYPLS